MSIKKIDYKKENKAFYEAKPDKFFELTIPRLQFLMINGAGDPNNSVLFKEACEALFSVSYKIKFSIKKSENIDYSVMPLEGLWWVEEGEFNLLDKKNWKWTLMVMQPDIVNKQHVFDAIKEVTKKKPLSCLTDLSLKIYEEGESIQTLHIGSYSEEQKTIDQLHNYINKKEYKFHGKHHEIYLNDPTRTSSDKLKTIIRQPIK